MGKLKLVVDKKARPLPISLKPKHILMLDELKKHTRKNRSRVIQTLIEREYRQLVESEATAGITNSIEEGVLNDSK